MGKQISGHSMLRIRVDPDGALRKQLAEAMPYYESLDSRLNAAITRAMTKTYLRAFETTFMDNLQKAMSMQVLEVFQKQPGKDVPLREAFQERTIYLAALHAARKLAGGGGSDSAKARRRSQERLDEARESYLRSTRRKAIGNEFKRSSSMASGSFRTLALQLLNQIADPNELSIKRTPGSWLIGAGPMEKVESFETPSATPELWGKPSSSPFQKLWRQLEYGTGNFADKRFARSKKSKGGMPDQSWVYPIPLGEIDGDGAPFVINVRFGGTKPMHVLKQVTEQSDKLGKSFLRFLNSELTRVS